MTVLCTGGELFDRVVKGVFTEQAAAQLVRQMLSALKFCHDHNIVHRDLKPENFVFEAPGDTPLKLIDFGCAVLKKHNDDVIDDVAGSPYYVAPEVLKKGFRRTLAIWKAADMWSVGVIIYLLVFGTPPFSGRENRVIFSKIIKGEYKIERENVQLSAACKDVIQKLLVMDPSKRLTVDQLLAHPWVADPSSVPAAVIPSEVIDSLSQFRTQCRLKKAVAQALANSMSDEDMEELKHLFKKFDKNNDGQLGGEEIRNMMIYIGRSEADAQHLIEIADENKDGVISVEEFAVVRNLGKLSTGNIDDLKELFDSFDTDKSGKIDKAELAKGLEFLSEEAAQKILAEVDQNHDGQIDFDEWITAMKDIQKTVRRKTQVQP